VHDFSFPSRTGVGVKAGGDRQALHEAIRVHSMAAGHVVKSEGKPNDLMDRIKGDTAFASIHDKLDSMINPIHFVGRAPEQVDEFISEEIDPILVANADVLNVVSADEVNV
jgi:adenylosuccinate lyase